MKLAEYEYSIKCKPDKKNKNALSRSSTEEIADEIKNMYPLQAKRVLFISNESDVVDYKKLKTFHPRPKRPITRQC